MKKETQLNLPLRVALIGVTGFGNAHFRSLQQLESEGLVKIAAATIINREEAAEQLAALEGSGCRIYADYQEMLDAERGNIDLCSIPTGIAWHCPMTVDALNAGCHVLVEKPVAGTLEEVDQMIAAREASGKRVFVGFHDLFLQPIVTMKQRILDGEIGRVKSVKVLASWPRPLSYYQRNNWAGKVQSGGKYIYDSPANNALAHYVMGALYFAGVELNAAARITSGEAELYRAKPIESFDTVCCRLKSETGVEVQFNFTHSGLPGYGPIVEITGEKGSVTWNFLEGISMEPAGDHLSVPIGSPATLVLFRELTAAMAEGREVGCSLEMAREHTRVINALHASCPIADIAEEYRYEDVHEESPIVVVKGMFEAMKESLETGKSLSETGIPWAQAASVMQFKD